MSSSGRMFFGDMLIAPLGTTSTHLCSIFASTVNMPSATEASFSTMQDLISSHIFQPVLRLSPSHSRVSPTAPAVFSSHWWRGRIGNIWKRCCHWNTRTHAYTRARTHTHTTHQRSQEQLSDNGSGRTGCSMPPGSIDHSVADVDRPTEKRHSMSISEVLSLEAQCSAEQWSPALARRSETRTELDTYTRVNE